MKNSFIHDYWSRSELGRKLLELDFISESDLLFLIPNNVKKMHGLPVTRCPAKEKTREKWVRRHIIITRLFNTIEESIAQNVQESISTELDSFADERLF